MRPWLYRIARNRCLNHLRRPVPEGQDSMDVMVGDNGVTTAERVQKREDFRALVADVQDLPETQRTALLLREIDALSYEEIAETMDTTIPAVKSLLVRARMSLAEATHSRQLTCGEVRLELAEAAEGIRKASGPVRHHVKRCEQCADFRGELRSNTKALAALAPIGPLALLLKGLVAKFGWRRIRKRRRWIGRGQQRDRRQHRGRRRRGRRRGGGERAPVAPRRRSRRRRAAAERRRPAVRGRWRDRRRDRRQGRGDRGDRRPADRRRGRGPQASTPTSPGQRKRQAAASQAYSPRPRAARRHRTEPRPRPSPAATSRRRP